MLASDTRGTCLWCSRPLLARRRRRGSPRRFCSARCRHACRTAAARWAMAAVEAGLITVSDLKAAQGSARALGEAFQRAAAPDERKD